MSALQTQAAEFQRQAANVGEWDASIRSALSLLEAAGDEVAAVRQEQAQARGLMDAVEAHQDAMAANVADLEERVNGLFRGAAPVPSPAEVLVSTDSIVDAVAARQQAYAAARCAGDELSQLEEMLLRVKGSLAAAATPGPRAGDNAGTPHPLFEIQQALNGQVAALKAIDGRATAVFQAASELADAVEAGKAASARS
jgi:hypothetical protein